VASVSGLSNDLEVVALLLDIAGAVWLARAFAVSSPEAYIAGTRAGETIGIPVHGDLARANDVADAQVGAPLLFLGFCGQALAALENDRLNTNAAWWLLLLLVPIAWLVRRWRSHVVALQTVEARLFAQVWEWAIVVDAYEMALGRDDRPPGQRGRGRILSDLFGMATWSEIEADLRRERDARKDAASWVPPKRPRRSYWRSIGRWRNWLF
jgi:hypothetical protein